VRCDWPQPGEPGRFTAHVPVRRGCDRPRRRGQFADDREMRSTPLRWGQIRQGEPNDNAPSSSPAGAGMVTWSKLKCIGWRRTGVRGDLQSRIGAVASFLSHPVTCVVGFHVAPDRNKDMERVPLTYMSSLRYIICVCLPLGAYLSFRPISTAQEELETHSLPLSACATINTFSRSPDRGYIVSRVAHHQP